MLNRLIKIVTLGFCLAFILPQMANAKFINFACELYGEEGIASDLWVIDPSQKIAIHEAASEYGKIKQYGLEYRVDEVSRDGIIFSIRLFDEYANRIYNLGIPSSLFSFINGGVREIERDIGRRLNTAEREALREVTTKMYQARMFIIIDFSDLKITYYSPSIKFDLSKTDKIFNVRPYETSENVDNGRCEII